LYEVFQKIYTIPGKARHAFWNHQEFVTGNSLAEWYDLQLECVKTTNCVCLHSPIRGGTVYFRFAFG